MAFGPGKYDDLCTYVREEVGITETSGGGVILIVVGGNQGHGFSCQADLLTTIKLTEVLEDVLKQLRSDVAEVEETGENI